MQWIETAKQLPPVSKDKIFVRFIDGNYDVAMFVEDPEYGKLFCTFDSYHLPDQISHWMKPEEP
jgi:hypothetical protein